jgi:uncharacterized protein YndB with AHSA1/START domain
MADGLAPILDCVEIARPIEAVWRVLTDEASVPNWLGCMRYKRAIGHVFYMQPDRAKAAGDDITGATHCEILALDAPRLFKFSWFFPDFPPTFVSFRLEGAGANSTRVHFEHDGWDKFPAEQIKPIRDMLDGGWKSSVLPNLKRAAQA